MIKRPLVIMLSAFVAGSMLADIGVAAALLIISFLFVFLVLFLFIFQISNRWINSLDKFLILIPILMYFGFLFMNDQKAVSPFFYLFEEETEGEITGTISQMIKKENSTAVYTINNQIRILGDQCYSSRKLLIYIKNCDGLKLGNKIMVSGKIVKFKPAANPGQFDEAEYYRINRIDFKVMEEKHKVINKRYHYFNQKLYEFRGKLTDVYRNLLSEKNAGIISAMILGEKSLLGQESKELYQQNGISHILAISGLHVSLIGMALFQFLRMIKINQLYACCFVTVFIYGYGVLTGFGVSTNRAVVMMIVSLFARVIGRTYDILSALSLSALIILIQSPMEIYNAGFLLSFGAILAITVVAPVFELMTENMCRMKFLKPLIQSFLTSFSINLMTIPVLLYFFYEIPIYSIVLNILIIPLSSILILLSILGGIAGCFHLLTGRFLIGGAHAVLIIYEVLCNLFKSLPGSTQIIGRPFLWQIIIYFVVLFLFLILVSRFRDKKNISYFLPLLLLLAVVFIRPVQKELQITFLDVGQGDGIFIQTPSGTTYLIDGGSSDVKSVGKYRIISFLKSIGVRRIDYAIITHTDKDHISGLIELMEESQESNGIRVKKLVFPNTSLLEEDDMKLFALAHKKKIPVVLIEKGTKLQDKEVLLSCLHPVNKEKVSSKNAYSTVLSLEYGEFKALFTGDLEKEGETQLLCSNQLSDYDLLKVAHHGSKYSSSDEFLLKTKPEIAIISCGKGNSYGHPHKELLDRLDKIKSKVFTTVDCGAITVKSNGKVIKIKKFYN